jgi:hypothetical protein
VGLRLIHRELVDPKLGKAALRAQQGHRQRRPGAGGDRQLGSGRQLRS